MNFDRVDKSFNARFYKGEVIAFAYRFKRNGVPISGAGKSYRLAILQGDTVVQIDSADVTIDQAGDASGVTLAFPSSVSEALYGSADLTYQVADVTSGTFSVIADGRLTILPSASDSSGSGSSVFTPLTMFERAVDGSLPVIEINYAVNLNLSNSTVNGYEYIGTGDPDIDTPGLRAVLALIKEDAPTSALVRIKPPFRFATPTSTPAFDMTGLPPTRFDWGGLVTQDWDPAFPETTIGAWIVGDDTTGIAHENFDYQMSPRPTFEGTVEVANYGAGYIRVRATPGFEPAFTTMDYFTGIDSTGRWIDRRYEGNARVNGAPYALADLGGGLYEFSPPNLAQSVTGVLSYNPLTLTIPNHQFPNTSDDDDTPTLANASGFVGLMVGGVSLLNGKTFAIDVVNSNNVRLLIGEDTIDASAATAYVSGGILDIPGVPDWLTVGMYLFGACRKRGPARIDPTYAKDWSIQGRFRSTFGVGLRGSFSEDIHVDLVGKGDGVVGCSAGLFVPLETRGSITGALVSYGSGDDAFNNSPNLWNDWITSSLASPTNAITVSNRVFPPRKGDRIRFEHGDVIVATLKALTVSTDGSGDSTVTFGTNVPASIDLTTWIVRNLDVIPSIRLDTTVIGGGRAVLAQTGDWQIGQAYYSGLRNSAIKCQYPASSAHNNKGGAYGGGSIGGSLTIENCNAKYFGRASAILHHWNSKAVSTAAAANAKTYRYPVTTVNGYDFCIVNSIGFNVYMAGLSPRNKGTRHLTTPETMLGQDVVANYDLFAQFSTLTIDWLDPECMSSITYRYKDGGRIVIGNRGQGQRLQTVDVGGSINTLLYGSHRITADLSTTRTYTLKQTLAQPGDRFVAEYVGTGGAAAYVDETSGDTIGTLYGQDAATFVNNGTRWLLSQTGAPLKEPIAFIVTGPVAAADVFGPYRVPQSCTLTGAFDADVVTPAAASATFTLTADGDPIGTVEWPAGVTTPVVTIDVGYEALAAGTMVRLEAPAVADAALLSPSVWLFVQ